MCLSAKHVSFGQACVFRPGMCLSAKHVSFGQACVSSMCFSPNHVSFGRAHVFFAPQVLVFVGCTRPRASAARRAAKCSIRRSIRPWCSIRGLRARGLDPLLPVGGLEHVSFRPSMCLSAKHVSQACVFRRTMCLRHVSLGRYHVFFADKSLYSLDLLDIAIFGWAALPGARPPRREGLDPPRAAARASIRGAASGKCSIPSVRSGGKCSIRRKCSIRASGKNVRSARRWPGCRSAARRAAGVRSPCSIWCSICCSIRRKCSIRGSGATGKSVRSVTAGPGNGDPSERRAASARSQVFDPECSIR